MALFRTFVFIIFLSAHSLAAYARAGSRASFDSGEIATQVDLAPQNPFQLENLFSPQLKSSTFQKILKDPEHRVQAEAFRTIPKALRSRTLFWLKIYGLYSSQQFVLFDSEDPDLIYEVIDLRPLAQEISHPVRYEWARSDKIESRIAEYHAAFKNLANSPQSRAHPKTPLEKKLVRLLLHSRKRSKLSIAEYHRQFRGQTGQRDQVLQGLNRAQPYWRWVEEILTQQGVPADLAKIALVESSFNTQAISRVGAQGVWQFMPDIAKHWLRLNDSAKIDERLSPLKSTLAAARLLRHNRQLLGTWPLAITAFHSGTRPFIEHSRSKLQKMSLGKLFSSEPGAARLGWAGRNYYCEFLAMNLAIHYQDWLYNVGDLKQNARDIRFLAIEHPMSLLQVSKQFHFKMSTLLALNPDIDSYNVLLPSNMLIAVPAKNTDLSDLLSTHDEFAKSFFNPYWKEST